MGPDRAYRPKAYWTYGPDREIIVKDIGPLGPTGPIGLLGQRPRAYRPWPKVKGQYTRYFRVIYLYMGPLGPIGPFGAMAQGKGP